MEHQQLNVMKKIFLSFLVGLGTASTVLAQIPTIDVSSLQQLYAQYRTMEQQLDTSKNILGKATEIYDQEVKTYQTALGNIDMVKDKIQSWVSSFRQLDNADFFSGRASPIQAFDRNVTYWANQLASGRGDVATLERRWETALSRVSAGTATDWEQRMALGGYNSKLIENANASRDYGSNVLAQSQQVISDSQQGTLIEQAGAQNALLYQQTALLDKMKNDVNDATVAEAAHREQQLQAEKNAAVIRRAMSNIPAD
jgi:hypothetical protein